MNRKTKRGAVLSGFALTFIINSLSASANGFAEKVYADFAKFSGNKVLFEVSASKPEYLASSKNLSVGSFMAPGTHSLEYRLGMINIYDAEFKDGNLPLALVEQRQEDLAELEQDLSLKSPGTFRLLLVNTRIGKDVRISEAVEFCWTGEDYCYLVDNSIPNIHGTVLTIRHLLASGYQEVITYDEDSLGTRLQSKSQNCRVQGTGSVSKTTRSIATTNTPVYAGGRIVGHVSFPASYVNHTCYDRSDGSCGILEGSAVPNPSGSANRGYNISCPNSKRQSFICGNTADFSSEQGCAFGVQTSRWGFGFHVAGFGCNAEVDKTGVNTVAIVTRALNQNTVCVSR